MILTFRPIKVWPEGWRTPKNRPSSPFSATYNATLQLLDRELAHLRTTAVTLQVDADERDVRLDGQLRATAKPNHPGCILTIETRRFGTLVYPCDAFSGSYSKPGWQANLRAIALGLEALRKVERYGIAERGQQYAGYRELPAGIAMERVMTIEEAAELLATEGDCGYSADDLMSTEVGFDDTAHPWINACYRMATKKHHPDVGGDPEMFRRLTEARDLLVAF